MTELFKELTRRLVLKGALPRRSEFPDLKGYREDYDGYGEECTNQAKLYRARIYDCTVLDWKLWSIEVWLPGLHVGFSLNEGEECGDTPGFTIQSYSPWWRGLCWKVSLWKMRHNGDIPF